MADNPKLNRKFTRDSVNLYYKFKTSQFPTTEDVELPLTRFSSVHDLATHLHDVATKLGIPLTECSAAEPYLWSAYIQAVPAIEAQVNIWKYREYVFACAMIFVGTFLPAQLAAGSSSIELLEKPRIIPQGFDMGKHSFTIVGSSELTSDIDITIEGPHSSFLISVIEDLFIKLTNGEGIPIRCWDVEFYGDFRILQSVFVNFSKFNGAQRLLLLKYAIISYFRSTHQTEASPPTLSPSVAFLIKRCLVEAGAAATKPNLDANYTQLIQKVYDGWRSAAPDGVLSREQFYKDLSSVERDSALILDFIRTNNSGALASNNKAIIESGVDLNNIAFSIFERMANANVNRAESYVLPSTAVHVVEFEQKKVGSANGGLPESWFASNARIGIDRYGFLLSAIEQLGYLEHYHPSDVECSKKGIKYFGRYVRALIQANILPENSSFVDVYKSLNAFRSSKSSLCGYNVHTLVSNILSEIETPVIKGGRRQGAERRPKGAERRRTRKGAERRPKGDERRPKGAEGRGTRNRRIRK